MDGVEEAVHKRYQEILKDIANSLRVLSNRGKGKDFEYRE